MRAAMSPLDNKTQFDVVTQNLIGNNTGNMIFAYSMFRTLMKEDTIIDTIATSKEYKIEEIKKINEEYDYFVIPLANAFRDGFIKELQNITKIVKNLTIPCIVTGVGIQKKIDTSVKQDFLFNEAAKEFICAVLEKSSMIGVRGEFTAAYLNELGFKEETDYTIIGCPSMYMFGKDLPKPKKTVLTKESRVCINYKIDLPLKLHHFMEKCRKQLPNFTMVPQSIEELRLLYGGFPYPTGKHKSIPKKYPVTISSKPYLRDKVKGFVNVPEWLKYLSENDFSFGSRIHGNIAGVLAGIPSYIFVYDSRILELAKYHNIPYELANTINSDTDIFDIYEKTDFNCIQRGHEDRFLHFLDFLKKNGLETIYDTEGNTAYAPFDEKIENLKLEPPIQSISSLGWKEREERMKLYYEFLNNKKEEFRLNNTKLKEENKQLKAELTFMKEKGRNNSLHRKLLQKLAL